MISIRESRYTVGDAIYCLDFFRNFKLKKVVVVTSDYYVDRTRFIFSHVFNKAVSLDVYEVGTKGNFDSEILLHEQQSLNAFCQTFYGVDFFSGSEMFTVIKKSHPFYNCKVYPKVSY